MNADDHPVRYQAIVIRAATGADAAALERLAALDSARPLAAPALIAEVGGAPLAALSLRDGRTIADPFHRTDDLVGLLHVRAGRRQGRTGRRAPLTRRTTRRPRHAVATWRHVRRRLRGRPAPPG